MKTTIPEKTIEVCDFCHREGYLTTCHVCGREYCLVDEGTVPACWGFTQICRKCAGRDDVQQVCQTFADKLTPIFSARDEALKGLPDNSPSEE